MSDRKHRLVGWTSQFCQTQQAILCSPPPWDSSAYSSIRSMTDLSLSASTLLPGYSSSTESSAVTGDSLDSTLTKISDSDVSRCKSLRESHITEDLLKESKVVPPAKPPRLFTKTKQGVLSDSSTIYIHIVSEDTELCLNSPNVASCDLTNIAPRSPLSSSHIEER